MRAVASPETPPIRKRGRKTGGPEPPTHTPRNSQHLVPASPPGLKISKLATARILALPPATPNCSWGVGRKLLAANFPTPLPNQEGKYGKKHHNLISKISQSYPQVELWSFIGLG